MNSLFSLFFQDDLFAEPYNDQSEYLSDLVKQAELMLSYYISCSKGVEETLDRFKGVIVTREQVDTALKKGNKSLMDYRKGVKTEFDKASFYIRQRVKASIAEGSFFAFDYIKKVYKFSEIESFLLILSLMPYMDSKYEKVYSYLHDDITRKVMTYELAIKIYFFAENVEDIEDYYKMKNSIEGKMSTSCFMRDDMIPDSRLTSFILSNGESEINLKGVSCYEPKSNEPLPVLNDIAEKIAEVIKSCKNSEESVYFNLNGCETIGKRTQVERVAQITNMPIVMMDISKISRSNDYEFYDSLMTACREVIIKKGAICFYNFDELTVEEKENMEYILLVLNIAQKFSNYIFVLCKEPIKSREISTDRLWIEINIPELSKDESILLWDLLLKEINPDDEVKAFEMANKFSFTAGQIKGTIEECKKLAVWNQCYTISKKDICRCAYTQVVHNLEEKATLIYAKHRWDQLVLAEEQKDMLKNACDQIRYKHLVYDKWGFNKRITYGRGVSMLFAGPPGTGKTMAAQVVADDLDIEIYKVDLSQIVSKYIGETEKNLNKLFEEAKKSNVILFFDETDALLGKRTEVKDSHDKNANLETSYLLQKMEEYDGITIMSSNYIENIDQAFFRRISYVIHFPFPDVEARKQIWKKMFPKDTPMSKDIDFDYLAQQFEISGGSIKNIAVTAAFLAVKTGKSIKMEHILKAIKYELTKQGKILLKEDFGEHGYML